MTKLTNNNKILTHNDDYGIQIQTVNWIDGIKGVFWLFIKDDWVWLFSWANGICCDINQTRTITQAPISIGTQLNPNTPLTNLKWDFQRLRLNLPIISTPKVIICQIRPYKAKTCSQLQLITRFSKIINLTVKLKFLVTWKINEPTYDFKLYIN